MSNNTTKEIGKPALKDAGLIFESVWEKVVEDKQSKGTLGFPKEVLWLNGAPGAGKGTQTKFILNYRGLSETPIIISSLLQSKEAQAHKDAGKLVDDKEVFALVLDKLLDAAYINGALVDGFPRTQIQAECIQLLYKKLLALSSESSNQKGHTYYSKPHFHIIVLFVSERESIQRQLDRGKKALQTNRTLQAAGMDSSLEIRKTDLNEETARTRYQTFQNETYQALQSLKGNFPYHFINAHGPVRSVQGRIIEELKYQSSLELSEPTFQKLSVLPLAQDLTKHARQKMVSRLEGYQKDHNELFHKIIHFIQIECLPIITQHANIGRAILNTSHPILAERGATHMLIDIFLERGFRACIEQLSYLNKEKDHYYRIEITFPGRNIREMSS